MTRREFFRDAAAAAAMPLVGGCAGLSGWGARHRSDYGGVQIGAITYSFRTMPMSRDCTVSHALGAGLGTIELMGCDFEREAGAPHSLKFGQWNLTKEQQHDLLEWRRTVDMGVVRELRRRYDDAGVGVHIVKFGGIGHMSPWETDYCFRVAQALGAGAITREPTISPSYVGGRTAILCGLCNLSYVHDTGFDWDPVKNDFANGTGHGIALARTDCRNGWEVKA